MVFHKRLDYGSNGYQVPPIPRVPRSARGKRSVRKKVEDKHMCAFDLLATIAEELLSGKENAFLPCKIGGTTSSVIAKGVIKEEHTGYEKPLKADVFDQGSCNESTKACSLPPRAIAQDATESKVSCKIGKFGTPQKTYPGLCKPDIGIKTLLQAERRTICSVTDGNGLEILNEPMDVDSKPQALVSSDSSVDVPIPRNASFSKCCNEISVGGADDENSSVCTNPRINISKGFRPQHIGDHKVRKRSASKFWKAAPKDEELSNTEMKGIYRNRKLCYTRQRTQKSSCKKRMLFDRCSISASYLDIYDKSVSPKLGGIKIEASSDDTNASLNEANGASSSTSGQKSLFDAGDYHVKLSIKSFMVPELFIEIPENATVGSLKRTVMEAVTAILGSGLRVGVLHQGKKVGDDSKTLLQAGISCNDKMDNLGFTLEPNATPITPSLQCTEDPNSIITSDASEQLKMIPAPPPTLELAVASEVALKAPESDHDSTHSPADACFVDKTADWKALVPLPSMDVEPLAVVPLRKSKRTELVQRRIRRPFSVSEVEALVQAVEKLGTGRWRDVKLSSFDNAKHRTYVDLKDKWKTLVHTARISPQQRRGELVPQELLDRVLSAHAYWSSHQAKPSLIEPCSLA